MESLFKLLLRFKSLRTLSKSSNNIYPYELLLLVN